jgi:chromosome segregation ATPase
MLATAAVFAAVVYVFQRESELQRREIDQAHQEIAAARADLLVEESRRQALDLDHASLLRRYEESNLSRDELASQLATSQSQVGILGARLAETLAVRDALVDERDELRARLLSTEAMARQLSQSLAEERERADDLEARGRQEREGAARARAQLEAELEQAGRRADEALGDLASARAERDHSDQRVRELEAHLAAREAERSELEGRLEELRQHVATLQSRMEQHALVGREPRRTADAAASQAAHDEPAPGSLGEAEP